MDNCRLALGTDPQPLPTERERTVDGQFAEHVVRHANHRLQGHLTTTETSPSKPQRGHQCRAATGRQFRRKPGGAEPPSQPRKNSTPDPKCNQQVSGGILRSGAAASSAQDRRRMPVNNKRGIWVAAACRWPCSHLVRWLRNEWSAAGSALVTRASGQNKGKWPPSAKSIPNFPKSDTACGARRPGCDRSG